MSEKLTQAVMLTGAAARISQEVAMLDKLISNKGLKLRQDNTLLAGFSSGSLNLAAINTCFRNSNPQSWDDYYKKNVLFTLKSKNVYKLKRLPFDTTPLRKTLNKFLKKAGFEWHKDLPFRSYVLTFSRKEFETLWACSRDAQQEYLNSSDLFMSSTAIPVVFPAQEIHCKPGEPTDFPGGLYNDGGTGGTFKRFNEYIGKYARENGALENLYIISPMREKGEDAHKIFDHIAKNKKHQTHLREANLGNISFRTFMKFLETLAEDNKDLSIAKNIFVSIPDMAKNYPILNFNVQEEQYKAVCSWVDANPDKLAIPLDEFVKG